MTIANTLSFLQNSAGALTTGTINASGAPVTVSISGSEKIRVDTNGYLLVNYSSSVGTYHLQVQGNGYFSGNLTAANLTVGTLTGSITTATSLAGGLAGQIPYQLSAGLTGYSNSLTFVGFNLGLGTNSPQSKIHVAGGTAVLGTKRGGGFTTLGYFDSNLAQDAYLEIANNASYSTGVLFSKGSNTGNYGLINYNNVSDYLQFFTAAAEKVRLDSTGTFLVGHTAQPNAGPFAKMAVLGPIVAGTSSPNGSVLMQGYYGSGGALTNIGTDYSSGGPSIGYACYPSNAASGAFFSSYNVGAIGRAALNISDSVKWYTGSSQNVAIGSALTMTEKMRLSNVGGLSVGTLTDAVAGEIRASNEITAYYTSDARLKENVTVISSPIEKLEQIRGVYFDWTDEYVQERGGEDGYFVRKHDIGVIAQEVEAVLPEIVATRDNGYKAVKYEKIVPLLIECIKEQQTQINQILERLEKLANK